MILALLLLPVLLTAVPTPMPIGVPCGFRPGDWCASPPGDPCGRHRNVQACQADPACRGMGYRGESVVACQWDARGFGTNCPTVGCLSAPR